MNKASVKRAVVIIDDDKRLHESITDYLRPYGFTVHSFFDGASALASLPGLGADLVLLDIMLPGNKDGFETLLALRSFCTIPLIIVSARQDETDRVLGLEMGADDYLTKPFAPRELLARMKALLRRMEQYGGEQENEKSIITSGPLTLDYKRHKLHWQGKNIALSTIECGLLLAFMQSNGRVLSRDALINKAFGEDHYTSERVIDVYINRLRNIFRAEDPLFLPINTVWGSGYRWALYD